MKNPYSSLRPFLDQKNSAIFGKSISYPYVTNPYYFFSIVYPQFGMFVILNSFISKFAVQILYSV